MRAIAVLLSLSMSVQAGDLQDALDRLNEQQKPATQVCRCEGRKHSVCLCLKEIKAGIRKKACTCKSNLGSEHKIDENGKPAGGTGKYFYLRSRKTKC
jgi:hypothetical protein